MSLMLLMTAVKDAVYMYSNEASMNVHNTNMYVCYFG